MKIQLNAKTLNNILKKVKLFVGFNLKKLPIMQTIKITASDAIHITATNLSNSIIVNILGEIFEQGEVCINFKELQQMIKSQTEDIIITDSTIENGITINYEPYSALEYPNIQMVEVDQLTTLSNDFITGLNTCLPHAWNSKMEGINRQTYEGVWIDKENIIASDTHTLVVYKQNEIQYPKNILIPSSAVKCIVDTFKKSNTIQCKINDKLMELSDNDYTIICRIYTDIEIPKYKMILQGLREDNYITVNTKYFKSIIDKLPVKEKYKKDDDEDFEFSTIVDLEMFNNNVTMNTLTVKPFEIKCKEVCGDHLKLSYYNHLMKKLINGFNEKENKELIIKFNGILRPFVIENDKMIVLGLPVRK